MDEKSLEELLRKRGEELDREPLLPPDQDGELRLRLAASVHVAGQRRRRLRLVSSFAAAAAVVLVIALLRPWERTGGYGGVTCELALLDAGGRPIHSLLRGGPGDSVPRHRQVHVELLPGGDGFAWVFGYDPMGARHALEADVLQLRTGAVRLRAYALDDFPAHPEGESICTVVVVHSARAIPRAVAAAALPEQLGQVHGIERDREVESVAQAAARDLGARVWAARFVLVRH